MTGARWGEWVPCSSSNVARVRWRETLGPLGPAVQVEFSDGAVYEYTGGDALVDLALSEAWSDLLAVICDGGSVGRFVRQRIAGTFPTRRVAAEELARDGGEP